MSEKNFTLHCFKVRGRHFIYTSPEIEKLIINLLQGYYLYCSQCNIIVVCNIY